MGSILDAAVALAGSLLSASAIRRLLRASLGERGVALCLHRVGAGFEPADRRMAVCTIGAQRLDALIDQLLASRPSASWNWLTVTFDDGYEDAATYVGSRAPRYPQVEFIYFVCPQKTERGIGFAWDAYDAALRSGRSPAEARAAFARGPDLLRENEREDLRALAGRPEYRLADPDAVRALGRLPNVTLGNHTNGHFRPVHLSDEQARREYARSLEDFTRLFGPSPHFAFPFGTPRVDVEERHVRTLRELGVPLLWSTESRPYDRGERKPGAVLPRFPVYGTWQPRQTSLRIAVRSVRHRLSGRRFAAA